MATFIFTNELYEDTEAQTPNDDPVVSAGQHMVPILEDFKGAEVAQKFNEAFQEFYKNEELHSIFELTLDEQDTIFSYVSQSTPEQLNKRRDEADGILTVLLSTLTRFKDEEDVERLALKMCDVFTASTDHPELKLKILMVLYNMFHPGYGVRFPVFKKILEFAGQTGQFEKLFPYLEHLDNWMEDWQPEQEEKSQLFLTLSRQMRNLDKINQAYAYLKRYIELFEKAPKSELNKPEVVDAARQLVCDSVSLPQILQVDDIVSLAAVENLGQNHAPSKTLVELLHILKVGTLDDLFALQKRSPALFESEGISFDQCLCKLRLLTLAGMAVGQSELPIDVVANTLQVSEDDVETWVVRALAQGVVDGRIDQVRRIVLVKSALQRSFKKKEWEFLDNRIDSWISNIESLMSTIATAKDAQIPLVA